MAKVLLKECPFSAVEKDIGHNLYMDMDTYQVKCSCGATGPIMAETFESSVKGWNTREQKISVYTL